MVNIIKTPQNYILHGNYYTTVMWHFTAKRHWRPYWEVSCSGSILPAQYCPSALNVLTAVILRYFILPNSAAFGTDYVRM